MHRKIIPDLLAADGGERTIAATETAHGAAQRMAELTVSALAVTDTTGHLAGLVTETDLMRRAFAPGADALSVADVMGEKGDVLAPDDSAADAFALMRARGATCLAVADTDGHALGVLALSDLIDVLADLIDADTQAKQATLFGA